jgi:MFS family permease
MSENPYSALRGQRGALAAISYMFLTNLDSIFVIPLLPILHGGTAAAVARDVAFALSLRLGASLALSLILPALAPRAGNAALLLVSSTMKAAAFMAILALPVPANLWCFAVLAGSGTGTLRPVVRAVIAEETKGAAQALAFQALFLVMNLAFVLGPLLAEGAMQLGWMVQGIIAVTALEIAAGLMALRLIPAHPRPDRPRKSGPIGDLLKAVLGSELWLLMIQMLLSYAAVGFLIASLVLYAAINPPLAPWRNFLLSAEGLAVILVQLALLPVFSHIPRSRTHALVALAAGTGLILSFSENLSVVFTGLAVFAMAECLAMPLAQLEISERVPAQHRRNVFAISMVAAAFGEIAGSWMAWAVTRFDSPALAAQGAGILIGLALAAVAWGLSAKKRALAIETAGASSRLADEPR